MLFSSSDDGVVVWLTRTPANEIKIRYKPLYKLATNVTSPVTCLTAFFYQRKESHFENPLDISPVGTTVITGNGNGALYVHHVNFSLEDKVEELTEENPIQDSELDNTIINLQTIAPHQILVRQHGALLINCLHISITIDETFQDDTQNHHVDSIPPKVYLYSGGQNGSVNIYTIEHIQPINF